MNDVSVGIYASSVAILYALVTKKYFVNIQNINFAIWKMLFN